MSAMREACRRTEREIEQEGRRILRRLAGARQVLFARGAVHAVARSPASAAASRVIVAADLVAHFAALDWIQPDGPGRHVIAPAGRALLARGGADGFAAQHRLMQAGRLDEDGVARSVQTNMAESPLARLKFRGLVDDRQFAAGERLRRDFTLGQLSPRMGVDWSAPVVMGARGGAHDTVSDVAIAARQRLGHAMQAAGPGLGDLLFDVCCHLTPLEQVEAARGWARRSARVVLTIALDRLAAHYGFDVVAGSARMRAWSMED
ncbi:MAG: DNA replication protein [Alphaproteobacteria bacterium]|nr:DNA replication protein [Alphaproteobacteria bacterium]